MREDYRLATAAAIARTFRIDPIAVLKADPFDWMVRIAAVQLIQEQESAAAKKAEADSKKNTSRSRRG